MRSATERGAERCGCWFARTLWSVVAGVEGEELLSAQASAPRPNPPRHREPCPRSRPPTAIAGAMGWSRPVLAARGGTVSQPLICGWGGSSARGRCGKDGGCDNRLSHTGLGCGAGWLRLLAVDGGGAEPACPGGAQAPSGPAWVGAGDARAVAGAQARDRRVRVRVSGLLPGVLLPVAGWRSAGLRGRARASARDRPRAGAPGVRDPADRPAGGRRG